MRKNVNIQRRKLMKIAGAGVVTTAAFVSLPGLLNAEMVRVRNQPSLDFNPDVEISLIEDVKRVSLFDGPKTLVWKVIGKVLKGDQSIITNDYKSYLAPTIRLHKGQKVRIYLKKYITSI